jgi:hypothetical protein
LYSCSISGARRASEKIANEALRVEKETQKQTRPLSCVASIDSSTQQLLSTVPHNPDPSTQVYTLRCFKRELYATAALNSPA